MYHFGTTKKITENAKSFLVDRTFFFCFGPGLDLICFYEIISYLFFFFRVCEIEKESTISSHDELFEVWGD